MTAAPDHFHMILKKGDPHYMDLPGLSVLIGGMWIANISYWGFNQYIIQRALAAKSLDEAQRGRAVRRLPEAADAADHRAARASPR